MATKTFKGASMPKSELDAYGVGLLRLSEAHINAENFKQEEIEYIGKCSIHRRKVVLGRTISSGVAFSCSLCYRG